MKRQHLFAIAGLFAGLMAVYVTTAAPDVMTGDSAELQAVAVTGGVAHPTGYPLFVMAGRVFGMVPAGTPAFRVTLLSAFCGAASAVFLVLVLIRLGAGFGPALAGAAIHGLAFTFWWSSIRAEVYTLGILLFLAGAWLVLRARERPSPGRAAWAAAVLGLAVTGHLSLLFAVVPLLIALLLAGAGRGRSRLTAGSVVVAGFLAGYLLPYVHVLAVDAGSHPVNYIDYTVEPRGGQFGTTPGTFDDPWERLPYLMIGSEYRPDRLVPSVGDLAVGIARGITHEFYYLYGPVGLVLFLAGAGRLRRIDRGGFAVLAAVITASGIFGLLFAEPRMFPIFIMGASAGVAVGVAFGLSALLRRIGPSGRPALTVPLVLLAVVVPPHLLRVADDRIVPARLRMQIEATPPVDTVIPTLRDYRGPRRLGERLLEAIPENALVVGKWEEIMLLYYLRHAEGRRTDLTLEPWDRTHWIRLEDWSRERGLADHPVVTLGSIPGLTDRFNGLERIPVDSHHELFTLRVWPD